MTTLTIDEPRDYELGDRNEFMVVAADIIYEGAAVGIVASSGYARPLTSTDRFVGFAEKKADNLTGAAGAKNVRTKRKGAVLLNLPGAALGDVGLPVYAQDDNAFSFVKTGGVFIGFARRWSATGYMMVEFDCDKYTDPHEGLIAETLTDNKTLDGQDTGKVFFVTADAKVVTLPAVAGMAFRMVNGGAFGTVAVSISPDAADVIQGPNLAGADDKDLINTKATACRGDYVDLEYGDATGWIVRRMVGTWAIEA